MSTDSGEDDDLFGPDNEEYQAITPVSRYRPPKLSPALLPRLPGGRHGFSDGMGRGQMRHQQQQQHHSNGFGSDGWNAPAHFGAHPGQYPLGQQKNFQPHWQGSQMVPEPSSGQYLSHMPPAGAPPLPPGRPPLTSAQNRNIVAVLKLGAVGHKDESLRVVRPQIQQPTEVAHFSRTADGTVHFDERCLRRFRPAVLHEKGADLNKGFESFVEKREGEEATNPFPDLLHAIRRKQVPLDNIHFVTFRNNMNKILGTAYNREDEWEMGVHKRGLTVYLDVHKLPEGRQSEQMRRFTYYGYAYERLATESKRPPGSQEPVDANEEFCAVMKTKLGAHRLMMGAEMDCYDRDAKGRKQYVELKTSREFVDERSRDKFHRFKLLKFWIQSFLAGVPRVVCGFRDDMGNVVRSEAMTIKDMTDSVKAKSLWEGGTCLAFADKVLCWLYGSLDEYNEDCILRFVRPGNRLELVRTDSCPPAIDEHCQLLASGGV